MKRTSRVIVAIGLIVAVLYLLARARHRRGQERVARRLGGLWNEPANAVEPLMANDPLVAAAVVAEAPAGDWPGYAPIAPLAPRESPTQEQPQPPPPTPEHDAATDVVAPSPERPIDSAPADIEEEMSVVTAAFERLAFEGEELAMEEALLAGFEGADIAEETAPGPVADDPGAVSTPSDSPEDVAANTSVTDGAPLSETAALESPVAPVEPQSVVAPSIEDFAVAPETMPSLESDVIFPEALEEALSSMDQISTNSAASRSAEGYLDEGNVYFNVGQYGLAADRYGRAVEADPTLVAGYYNRANALTRSGDYETALGDYDKALLLQPNDADALNNRGMLHLYRAAYEDALRDFDNALALEPGDTTVMVNRGLAYLHSGHAREALSDFEAVARIDWNDAAALYGAGQAAAQLADRQAAMRHLRRALEVDPGYAREAAADPKLAFLQGDHDFIRLLREAGAR
jgi:tetratricopeptide (TPR) repeat protein